MMTSELAFGVVWRRGWRAALIAGLAFHGPGTAQECSAPAAVEAFGAGTPGSAGVPELRNVGAPIVRTPYELKLLGGPALAPGILLAGLHEVAMFLPPLGGTLYVGSEPRVEEFFVLDGEGSSGPLLALPVLAPSLCGVTVVAQAAVLDPAAMGGFALTQGLRIHVGVGARLLFGFPLVEAGDTPNGIAQGDLNGDGLADLLVANTESAQVSAIPGIGGGTFGEPILAASGGPPNGVDLVDLDADGDLDAACANDSGSATVLLGQGDLTFVSLPSVATGAGSLRLHFADLDADGTSDFAVTNEDAETVTVHLGLGDTSFAPAAAYATGGAADGLAIGDLNLDGAPDVVVSNFDSQGSTMVFLGLGDGTLGAGSQAALAQYSRSVAADDLNFDGVLDLAIVGAGTGGGVLVHLGQGDGTFAAGIHHEAGGPADVVIDDMNGDSVPDLVVVATLQVDHVGVLEGVGDGTFAAGTFYPGNSESSGLVTGDLDGDALPDAAVTNYWNDSVSLVRGAIMPFASVVQSLAVGESLESVEIADLDDDGEPDLVACSEPGEVVVFRGLGVGSFGPSQGFPAGVEPRSPAFGDLNGDGVLDVAVANAQVTSGSATTLLGLGGGILQTGVAHPAGVNSQAVDLGDLNGDGILDLAVANWSSDDLTLLFGVGNGTFLASSLPAGDAPQDVCMADLDANGALDLVITCVWDDELNVFVGGGDGTFAGPDVLPAGDGPRMACVQDLNGDGVLDIAVPNEGSGAVSVHLGLDGAAFDPAQLYPAGHQARYLACAELDGDGILDLAVINPYDIADPGQRVSILRGAGDGAFKKPEAYMAGVFPTWIAAGDLDSDGVPDLAISHEASEDVRVLRNLLLGP